MSTFNDLGSILIGLARFNDLDGLLSGKTYDDLDALLKSSVHIIEDLDGLLSGKTYDDLDALLKSSVHTFDDFFGMLIGRFPNDLDGLLSGKTYDDLDALLPGKLANDLNCLIKCTVAIGRRLSLSDSCNLRSTNVYVAPRDISTLSLVYGDFSSSRIKCTSLDKDGYIYHISDFKIHSIIEVQVDEEPKTYGYKSYTSYQDSTGKPIACIVFDNPQYDSTVSVSCRGIVKASGELISNPADVIRHILINIQGYDSTVINEVALSKFYADSINGDIRVALYINEPIILKELFDKLAINIWCRWLISDGKQIIGYRQ